jgi:hypothetical protein
MAAVLQLAEGAAPSTPGSGYHDLYFDTSGDPHILKDDGTNKTLAYTDIVAATANIADAAVTNVKLADMAEETIKGRASGAGTGDATDLTAAQVAAILGDYFPALGDATWTDLTLTANWITTSVYPSPLGSYSPTWVAPACRLIGGICYLRGHCKSNSNSADYVIATLGAAYRPAADTWLPIYYSNSTTTMGESWVVVKANGELLIPTRTLNYSYSFDGLSFPV